jgi:phosphoribosylformylglycinamidine cyclo-ligase
MRAVASMTAEAYRRAGVDIDAAAEAVTLIGDLASRARRPEVADQVGGFAGLFRIGDGRLLAASTDGVGTKLEIARATGRLDTVGIDLVAMCADDVVCTGAEPLFFLDYLAVGAVVPERVASIVEGVVEGCRRAGCALLGGETAEHPGTMADDAFDLAGFCVGAVDRASLLGPDRVREGDVLIGLVSSGLHANGYSLVRHALLARHALDEAPPELGGARTIADELLEPCAIYAPAVLALARDELVHAAAHVTGGGVRENLPRALPEGTGAELERGTWPEPPIFELVRDAALATDDDMFSTFNMGIGMVLAVDPLDADRVLAAAGPDRAFRIGRVVTTPGVHII